MQPSALHPFDPSIATFFVQAVSGDAGLPPEIDPVLGRRIVDNARSGMERARSGQIRGYHELTAAFGELTAAQHPSFAHDGLSLTAWEAQIDRGAGMLLRPPARLLIEAGLDPAIGRKLDIRLDFTLGMMGGAWVPPKNVPLLASLLDERFDRLVKRLVAAEFDPYPYMSLIIEAVDYAQERNLGLFESLGVVLPDEPASVPAGGTLVIYDKKRIDPDLKKRIEIAARPPKTPGRLARLLGQGKRTPLDDVTAGNGHVKFDD
ncbi:MAG: hypothetical protein R2843_06290 [Thermomicrobiales bacterium]